MPILAYSTIIPVRDTISAIDDLLMVYGAHNFTKLGPSKAPTGVAFVLDTELGSQRFILPVRTVRVHEKLLAEYDSGKVRLAASTPEHAERVAWRQLFRWLESHLAAIDGGLFTAAQVMIPFLEIAPGYSIYELLEAHPERLGLPAPQEVRRGS